jgi:hypothetical protein
MLARQARAGAGTGGGVLARVRVNVPDLPGVLGKVASAIGGAGGDIVKLDVLESETGRALDDVFLQVRDLGQAERVRDLLTALPGVYVLGLQVGVPPVGGHSELELVAQVMDGVTTDGPQRGARTLVDGAPGALGADWASLISFGPDDSPGPVLAASPLAPPPDDITLIAPRRLAALTLRPAGSDQPYLGVALVPLGRAPLGLLLVRETGPQFHRTELWRLEQLGRLLGAVLPGVPIGSELARSR